MAEVKAKITVGILKETYKNELRTAIVPETAAKYLKLGFEVVFEEGAGSPAGFTDEEYSSKGAEILKTRDEVFKHADIILQVRGYGANPDSGKKDIEKFRKGQLVIGFFDPLSSAKSIQEFAKTGASAFAIELLPRITRAQSMDALSSQATIGGYKAVLIGAEHLSKMFPMLMTAAGTISPAHVFVIGAGVAGLQAIATAKRLGGVVQAYDVRPVVKEQVESLGAKFVELELSTEKSEDKGGYAKAMDEDFYRRQREMMSGVLKASDIVITTAAVPGRKAPVLITDDMVNGMASGSVIVDMAADSGGNCSLTKAGEIVEHHGVKIIGPQNLASSIPYHASQMYSRNLFSFVRSLVKDGKIQLNMEDEVIRDTLLTKDGEVVNSRVREALGLENKSEGERSEG